MEGVKSKIGTMFYVEVVKYKKKKIIRSRLDVPNRLIARLHQYK
jgi:hypothetical protein